MSVLQILAAESPEAVAKYNPDGALDTSHTGVLLECPMNETNFASFSIDHKSTVPLDVPDKIRGESGENDKH